MDSSYHPLFRLMIGAVQIVSAVAIWFLLQTKLQHISRLYAQRLPPVPVYYTLQTLLILFLATAVSGRQISLTFLVFCAVTAFTLRLLYERQRRKSQQHALRRALPHTLDLLALTMLAGRSLQSAILQISTLPGTGPLGRAFNKTMQQTQRGLEWQRALQEMAQELAVQEIRLTIDVMLTSQQTGGSIATTLRDLAQRFNQTRLHRAEQGANRLPLLLMAPLFICILPSSFLILFLPLWLRMALS